MLKYADHIALEIKGLSNKWALGKQLKVKLTKAKGRHFMKLMRYSKCARFGDNKRIQLTNFKTNRW